MAGEHDASAARGRADEFDAILASAAEPATAVVGFAAQGATAQGATAQGPAAQGTVANSERPAILDFSMRERRSYPRASVLEWIGLALALLLPPLGLLLSLAGRIVARRRHGWTTVVTTASTALSVSLTVILAGGALALGVFQSNEAANAALLADAEPFCSAVAGTPGLLESPAFGWPTQKVGITESIERMGEYAQRWQELAGLAPAAIADDAAAIADAAGQIVDEVTESRLLQRQDNLDHMVAVTSATGIVAFSAEWCD